MGWRGKFVFTLMVYVSGFLTAVYFLAPTKGGDRRLPLDTDAMKNALQSQNLTDAVNSGMHKCIDLGKDVAARASLMIKDRIQEAQTGKSQK